MLSIIKISEFFTNYDVGIGSKKCFGIACESFELFFRPFHLEPGVVQRQQTTRELRKALSLDGGEGHLPAQQRVSWVGFARQRVFCLDALNQWYRLRAIPRSPLGKINLTGIPWESTRQKQLGFCSPL